MILAIVLNYLLRNDATCSCCSKLFGYIKIDLLWSYVK